MPWKNDLSKLKAQLKEDPPAPAPAPPKPKTPTVPSASIEEQDALFLAAMGGAKPAPKGPSAQPAQAPQPKAAPAPEPEGDFASAMAGLKGMKPMAPAIPAPPPPKAEIPRPVAEPPREEAAPEPPPAPKAEEPALPETSTLPQRIQLAAGMAVEVDGQLDLRGHSLGDALARLADRLADARFMRWRCLLVTLGGDSELHQALLDRLQEGGLPQVHHYAQAPIPMGGTSAWILYLSFPEFS